MASRKRITNGSGSVVRTGRSSGKSTRSYAKSRINDDSKYWDFIGIAIAVFGLMLLLSLVSYNSSDFAEGKHEIANWIGIFGAYLGHGVLWTFGLGAYLIPLAIIAYGLSMPLTALRYLQHRWGWMLVLTCAVCCGLDIYETIFPAGMCTKLSTCAPGGLVGHWMNDYAFFIFGTIGATTILVALYIISIISLTNIRLEEWVSIIAEKVQEFHQEWVRRRKEAAIRYKEEQKRRAAEKRARQEAELAARKKAEAERRAEEERIAAEERRAEEARRQEGLKAETERKAAEARATEEAKRAAEAQKINSSFRSSPTILDAEIVEHSEEEDEKEPIEEQNPISLDEALKENTEEEQLDVVPALSTAVANRNEGESPAQYEIIDAYSPEKLQQRAEEERQALERIRDTHTSAIDQDKPTTYQLPSIDLMAKADNPVDNQLSSKTEMMENAEHIRETLSAFKLEVKPGPITRGPTVTMYEFIPPQGVKMSRFTSLDANLQQSLKAISINILAPIPGKDTIGIEVPNHQKIKVVMRELLESEEWQKSKARIPIALGKDIYGKAIIADLASMPHLLVAGATGSGKSVCINAIIASLLYRFTPEELRFVMVDPKVVELQQYNALPHMIVPVVTDPKKVVLTLQWVVNEMEKRYKIFAQVGVRNIQGFNKRPIKSAAELAKEAEEKAAANAQLDEMQSTDGVAVELDKEISVPRDEDIELSIPDRLSYIVLIIDELADLMVVAGKEVESQITRITQMARAAGIHCIVATQRPSVDIITGVIKSNIPSRIAFQVAAAVDSRTILDCLGAEKLLGKGDMLFLPPGTARMTRVQGALITDEELDAILQFISNQAKPTFVQDFLDSLSGEVGNDDDGDEEDEDLIQDAIDVILTGKRASTSYLQRKLSIGYNRAARIMDTLEKRHVVGPSRGSKDREILMK